MNIFILLLSKSLNLIGCRGSIKRKFNENILKILLRNHKGDEVDNWHTILGN